MTDSEFLRRSLTSEMPRELLLHDRHLQEVTFRAHRRSRNRRVVRAAGGLAVASTTGIAAMSVLQSAPEATVADGSPSEPASSAMAEPWSDVAITSPEWLPNDAFLVTEGRSSDGPWQVVSARLTADEEGCLLTADPASMAKTRGVCFDKWPTGDAAQYYRWPLTTTDVLIVGAVSAEARTVRVELADGTTVTTDAIATPSSDTLRYFAVPTPTSSVKDVAGFTAEGELSSPPPGLPWAASCAPSDPPCPTRGPN